jgi:hypothetical protein
MLFLVDTAATSLLNLQSFFNGDSREVEISSYRGRASTRGREVSPPEMTIGSYHLVGVKMMAIDLSALGAGCGRRIDGILGADLLERMGATIDFKRQVVHFMTADERQSEELIAEASRDVERCLHALKAGDEKELKECLDLDITVFGATSSVYSKEQALAWLEEHLRPGMRSGLDEVRLRAESFHAIGEAMWFEYDFTAGNDSFRRHGTAMCRKVNGRWRISGISPGTGH